MIPRPGGISIPFGQIKSAVEMLTRPPRASRDLICSGPIAWALFYLRLGAEGRAGVPVPALGALHVAGLWLLTAMIAAEFAVRLDRVAGDGWFHAAWGAIAALALWLTVQYSARWPMRTAPRAYAEIGVPGLAVMTALWLVWANVRSDGDPSPLRALPLANPL